MKVKLFLMTLFTVLTLSLAGCAKEKGPMEKMGESMDDAAESIGDKAEEVADDVKDAAGE